jgi:tRNA (cytidine/uridine-2'-O-)-methyltransferase
LWQDRHSHPRIVRNAIVFNGLGSLFESIPKVPESSLEKGRTMPALKIALYQPDIPGNTGTILRFAACMGLTVDIIEPAGFILSDKNLRRAGMDYIASVTMARHVNHAAFEAWRAASGRRLVLASTKAAVSYIDFAYRPDDILLFGRESAGVPDHVHEQADARILIPMAPGQRSINVALSAAMIAGEALRQTGGFAPAA